ncbi:hypothetical protein S7711_09768 [Stachybotrys chartarum IBT 7711]|uniref:Uncharacterized protein n=1 Tax=Stachybotrys chartarum (strain CBS 109288 / IBT 7711) TaxID=1280523 RepID=A0A084BBG7_STACB|nr:hypothetical protein S7711_09768 [Stachybotrys chartarum IBT 7711]
MVSTRSQSRDSKSDSIHTEELPQKRARLSSERIQLSQHHNFRPPLLSNPPPPYQHHPSSRTDRWTSPTNSAPSIRKFYTRVDEDDNPLDNIFAAIPDRFTTIPEPRRSQPESLYELQFNHTINLRRDFPRRSGRQDETCQAPIPGPQNDPFKGSSSSSPRAISPPTATREEFQFALRLVQQVVGEKPRLTRE